MSFTEVKAQVLRMNEAQQQKLMNLLLGVPTGKRTHEPPLRTKRVKQLSWPATIREMAAAKEDWSDWEAATADGLDEN